MRVGLFIPCYVDAFFPEVGIATLEILERCGVDVSYPLDQTCCGQPMANSGKGANSTPPPCWTGRGGHLRNSHANRKK